MSAPSASPDPSVPNPPSAPSIPSALSARIDAGALAHNIAAIAARIAPCRLMCIVKADAYGHGLGAVVPAALAAGIREFGVATPAEALAVRALLAQAGAPEPGAGTRILCWLYDETADLAPLVAEGIEVGLPNPGSLARLEAAARTAGRPALAHVKLDTGLGRSGLTAAQLGALLPALAGAQGVRIVGVMTHFACADEVGHPANAEQLAAFGAGVESLRGLLRAHPERGSADELLVHCANSPAALSMAPVPGDLARVGLSLYGLSPFADRTGADLGLRPAMELRSSVLTVKVVPAGHGASYGLLYRAPRDTRFALIAGGYADGIPRAASGSAQVTIRGRRFPVVGRIAMDQMIADIGPADAPDALPIAPGDTVIVMGDGTTGPSAEEWGAWSGSINYEIVTRVGPRADRVTVGRPPEDPAAPAPAAVQAAPASAELAIADLDAMGRFGKRLAGLLRAGDVLILTGDLGAGKTTLTQSIAAGLGVRGRVSSPTFVIAREHAPTGAGPGLVHVDAYRLGSAAELDDLGLEDALADSAAVIEWGAGLAEQLSAERLEVSISADPATEDRTIALTPHGTWGERLRAAGLGAADRDSADRAGDGQGARP
ncbi:alanine racemase [Brevibacterium sp. BRM-1]|uniref:alanine racemase n=1 Tax=Brevibacterium sp. BRM-1 TaxID=2999062 RepID=UPI0022818573|nr:alanine racemase [Brevibacterium sp. BRM-1]WAL40175.1 alanine racemase [Brevibacterium sp. BRM-1]